METQAEQILANVRVWADAQATMVHHDGRTGTVRLATGPWVYVGFDAGGERVFDASELEHA